MFGKIKELYLKKREIIDYLFWGVMTTLVSWISFSLFSIIFELFIKKQTVSFLGIDLPVVVTLANVLSWVCAVVFAFFVNKLWVFRSKSFEKTIVLPEFFKFVSTRIATGIFEVVMVPLAVSLGLSQALFSIDGMVAKILVSVVVIVLNYIFSKLFVFKRKK